MQLKSFVYQGDDYDDYGDDDYYQAFIITIIIIITFFNKLSYFI